ncbi:MAG: HEAT repeat domain-containing protein [Kiloniellales bacterium]
MCAALCRVLGEGIDMHRCLAARVLGRIGDPGGVEALIAALLDQDEDVRTDAAAALARMAPPEAGRQLLGNLLGDPCTQVKLNAIDALTCLRHPELVPWLRRMLKGRDQEIAWDEAGFYEDGWDDWVDVQVKAVEALAELGIADAVPEIVGAIDDELGQDLSETGFKALARLGDPGIEAVAGYLEHADERRRRRAAAVLAACESEAARPALARALQDHCPDVRLAAARALAARDAADQRLAPLLADRDPEVRAQAVRLCGRHHPRRIEALLEGDRAAAVLPAVLDLAAEAPDLLARDQVAEKARSLLGGADASAAASAAVALAAVAGEAALVDLVEQLTNTKRPLEARLGAARALAKLGGEPAVGALARVLGDDERQLRLEAIAALATLAAAVEPWPNPPGETLLAALSGELVPEPRAETGAEARAGENAAPARVEEAPPAEDEAAAEAFPKSTLQSILGDTAPAMPRDDAGGVELTQRDLDRLALAARTPRKRRVPVTPKVAPHRDVRRFAARVLGDLARDEIAGALAEALNDSDAELRRAVADSLARIGARTGALPRQVVDALLRALGDGERDVRLSAVRALGAAGSRRAAKPLIDRLRDDDSSVRAEALTALARLGAVGPEVESLIDDREPAVRLAAARAVAAAGGVSAVERLGDFAFAHEGTHRREAGRLLRGLDRAAGSVRFLEVLDDPNRRRLWPVAIEALEEIHRTDPGPSDGSSIEAVQQEGAGAP